MRCHICDADIPSPKADPHDPKKLLPCEACLEVIQSITDTYKQVKEPEPYCEVDIIIDEEFDTLFE